MSNEMAGDASYASNKKKKKKEIGKLRTDIRSTEKSLCHFRY